MKNLAKLLVWLCMGLGYANTMAHHSFSATYDESKEAAIEGTIVQFLLRNPHSMLHVEVKGPNGEPQRYAIEWAGAGGLSQDGITRTTLRVGDVVKVSGNPGRNRAEFRLRMLSIERPIDGWKWGGTYN